MDNLSLERRDRMIDDILAKVLWETQGSVSQEELDRYEGWLLTQKDFVLTNKIVF